MKENSIFNTNNFFFCLRRPGALFEKTREVPLDPAKTFVKFHVGTDQESVGTLNWLVPFSSFLPPTPWEQEKNPWERTKTSWEWIKSSWERTKTPWERIKSPWERIKTPWEWIKIPYKRVETPQEGVRDP